MAPPEVKEAAGSTSPANPSNLLQMKPETYGDKYKEHLLQQYVMYVGTADEVSSRRALSNTFFLTVSTALVSVDGLVIGNALGKATTFDVAFVSIFTVAAVLFATTWYKIIRSYDQLNTGKFAVIHELEKALPAALFTAEWIALGRGKDPSKYRPLSRIEAHVPLIFIGVYLFLAIGTVVLYMYAIGAITH